MLYLAFIWHMHQPYYRDLITNEAYLPWVRLHGIKDYLDMLKVLEVFPGVHQTFNLVPCLIDQIQDYTERGRSDYFLDISYKRAQDLTAQERQFILENFFMADVQRIIAIHPRYYELFFKRQSKQQYTDQDFLDLQVWFNLGWFDPYFRKNTQELNEVDNKGRFFSEDDKKVVLDKQKDVLKEIIPAYKKLQESGQIEITTNPYYHPILPLLYNTAIAKESNPKTQLPNATFSYKEDAFWHLTEAVKSYTDNFGVKPAGMWPSEEAMSEQVVPLIIKSGIKWIVTDESLLFRSLKRKRRAHTLYRPYCLEREEGTLNVVFRDTNLSDLLGFSYQNYKAEDAANDLMKHLQNISSIFKNKNCLVTLALDGENPWEYYPNDGWDFLQALYKKIQESSFVKAVTVSEYLGMYPPEINIKKLAAGSWIYGTLNKWIGSPKKNLAWEYLTQARDEFEQFIKDETKTKSIDQNKLALLWKQIHVCEGSDWFWWYDDNNAHFDELFRKHMANFYKLLDKNPPDYVNRPL